MDRELAAALAGELPAAANIKADAALPVQFTCPQNSRGAMFMLPDGQLSVLKLSAGASMLFDSSSGATTVSVPTSTGLTVIVVSVPATPDGPAPYASDLNSFARTIARIY